MAWLVKRLQILKRLLARLIEEINLGEILYFEPLDYKGVYAGLGHNFYF